MPQLFKSFIEISDALAHGEILVHKGNGRKIMYDSFANEVVDLAGHAPIRAEIFNAPELWDIYNAPRWEDNFNDAVLCYVWDTPARPDFPSMAWIVSAPTTTSFLYVADSGSSFSHAEPVPLEQLQAALIELQKIKAKIGV